MQILKNTKKVILMSKHHSPNQCHIRRCLRLFCQNILQAHRQTNTHTLLFI